MNKVKVVLVRHGHSVGNKERRLTGWTDVVLTPEGIEELTQFRDSVDYPVTDRYVSSSLTRCQQTFEHLFSHKFPLEKTVDGLREIYFGDIENVQEHEIDFRDFFDRWIKGEKMHGAESIHEFADRIHTALKELVAETVERGESSLTVVTHSGVIRMLDVVLRKMDFSHFHSKMIRNGLGIVFTLTVDDDKNLIVEEHHYLEPRA